VTLFGIRVFADIISSGSGDKNNSGFRVGFKSNDL
jgi:hypothetical protein